MFILKNKHKNMTEEITEVTTPEESTVETPENVVVETPEADDKGTSSAIEGVQPEHDSEELIASWGKDRVKVDSLTVENFKLKQQLAVSNTPAPNPDEEIPMDDQVNAEIKRREEEAEALKSMDVEAAKREISFNERVNPTFRANKAEILKISIDAKVGLNEAIKLFEARKVEAKTKIEKVNKKTQIQAGNTSIESAKGVEAKRGYDPVKDKDKSINDLYSGF